MPLTALDRFSAEDLNPGELIIYRARLHPIALLVQAFSSLAVFLFGLIILMVAFLYRGVIGFLDNPAVSFAVFLAAGIFLLGGGYRLLNHLIDWYFDEDIITNQRLIDNNQDSIFSQHFITANIRSVEEIALKQQGFLRTVFDFGTLVVKTAARSSNGQAQDQLLFYEIAHPKRVQRLIDEIGNRVKREVDVVPEEVLRLCGL